MKFMNGPQMKQLDRIKTWQLRQETNGFKSLCLIMHHAHPLTEVLTGSNDHS